VVPIGRRENGFLPLGQGGIRAKAYEMNSADKLGKPQIGPELDDRQDRLAEEILSNMNHTPVGKLLKIIAALPEIRQDKVDQIKLELSKGTYNLDQNLDAALDAILEELMMR
jgi:anti-sigma28 factor (negative regulator of flagellin synthesis)